MDTLVKQLYEREGFPTDWDDFIREVQNPNGYTAAKKLYVRLCNQIVESWSNHR